MSKFATTILSAFAFVLTANLACAADADGPATGKSRKHQDWDFQVLYSAGPNQAPADECAVTDSLASNSANSHYRSFGCAVNANIQSMIANPNDITQHRTMSASPAETAIKALATLPVRQ